jgi:WD40 repeat protein
VSIWDAPPFSPGFLGFKTEDMGNRFERPDEEQNPLVDGLFMENAVFDPSGGRLATANEPMRGTGERLAPAKTNVEIWDTLRGSLLLTLPHVGKIHSIKYSSDGSHVLTCSFFKEPDPSDPSSTLRVWTARVWDARTGKLMHEIVSPFKPGEFAGESAAFSTDGDRVAFVDKSQTVISIHDTTSGKSLRVIKISPSELVWWSLLDGGRLLAACEDGRVLEWDAGTRGERLLYRHPSKLLRAVKSPDGSRLALHAAEKPDVIVDLHTGVRLLELPPDIGEPAAWSSNAATLVANANIPLKKSYCFNFWDVRANKPISSITNLDPASVLPPEVAAPFIDLGRWTNPTIDPNGEWLWTSEFLEGDFWSAKTGRRQFELVLGSDAAFSSDGRFFAYGRRLYSTVPVRQLGQISGDAVPASDFELMARFLTARKLSDECEVRPLDYDEWRAAGDELRARAARPGPLQQWAQWLTTSGPDAPVWPGGPPMPKE